MAAVAQLHSMLGLRIGAPGCITYLDETDVQFIAGRNLIRYDSETRSQRIHSGSLESVGITAVAVTPNKRYTAYAELGTDGYPIVSVFDWVTGAAKKKKKLLTGIDVKAPVTSLAFTPDGKHLIVQTAAPDFYLYVILWDKGAGGRVESVLRNVSTSGKGVVQADCSPEDPTLYAITGHNVCKLYRQQDESFRPLPVNLHRDPCPLVGHAWMSDFSRLVVATVAGDLLVLENGDVKKVLDAPPTTGVKVIGSLVPTAKGFLVGCENGILRVYERAEDPRFFYRFTKQYQVPAGDGDVISGRAGTIISLALSPTEEDVIVGLGNSQSYVFRLSAAELSKGGDGATGGASFFRPFIASYHTVNPPIVNDPSANSNQSVLDLLFGGPNYGDPRLPLLTGITGIDTCLRKPIFVTAGSDRAVRVWNYTGTSSLERGASGASGEGGSGASASSSSSSSSAAAPELAPVMEISQKFPEVPTCIAIHPMGFHLVIGFDTSVQLCALMMDGIRVVKELPVRQAAEVRFSHGGHMFAVAAGSSVNVYNTFSCAPVATLRGHADRVLSIAWAKDDRHLISVGKDGMVSRWAVSVPNATSSGPSTARMGGGAGGGDKNGSRPSSALNNNAGPLSLVGKMINSVDMRDLHPFSVTTGLNESGKDVYVAGSVLKGIGASASHTPVLRHIDLSASSKSEIVKADTPLRGFAAHSLALAAASSSGGHAAALAAPFAVLAGMGRRVTASGGKAGVAASSSNSSNSATSTTTAASPAAVGTLKRQASQGAMSASTGASETAGGAAGASNNTETGGRMYEAEPVGCLRIYRPSLGLATPGDTQSQVDVVCHATPLTRMCFTPDGKLLFTGASDGSIAVWTITDPHHAANAKGGAGNTSTSSNKAGGAAAANNNTGGDEPLGWSEDVCVTKKTLDAVMKEKNELENKVSEINLVNKYAEREKEAENEAKLAQAEEESAEAVESAHDKVAELRSARELAEQRFREQVASMEGVQSSELEELESTYSQKLKNEIARYDRLVAERDRMNAEYETGMSSLAREQTAEIHSLRSRYEAALAEENEAVETLTDELSELAQEIKEMADAIERDVDGEIEDTRARFEVRLKTESEATLKVRGENGLMKRKFVNDTKVITEQKEELNSLGEKEKELQEAISALQKDVAGHKKEIKEREETISDKEARIYELKKKNQELEKFKFVLNYKIQELKRQIMPKKKEIADMREQLKEMELELLQYHKTNAALDLMINELKLKRDGMVTEVDKLRGIIAAKDDVLLGIGRDVTAVRSQALANPKGVQVTMYHLYHKYIHGDAASLSIAMASSTSSSSSSSSLSGTARPSTEGGAPALSLSQALAAKGADALAPGVNLEDLQNELARQRQHLERGVDGMKRRIEKESAVAASDRARLLRENAQLTQEINDLRRETKYLQAELAGALGITTTTTTTGAHHGAGGMLSTASIASSNATSGVSNNHTSGAGTTSSLKASGSIPGGGRRTAAVLGVVGAAGKKGMTVSPIRTQSKK